MTRPHASESTFEVRDTMRCIHPATTRHAGQPRPGDDIPCRSSFGLRVRRTSCMRSLTPNHSGSDGMTRRTSIRFVRVLWLAVLLSA